MIYIRKSLLILSAVVILTIFLFNNAKAESGIIYKSAEKQTITSGVTLEKITRFTVDGWLEINVLRANLSNHFIRVDTLINTDSVKSLTSAKTLAQSRGAVAAINAGFFNWMRDPAGTWGYPDGPVVESGRIISASGEFNKNNNSMATFSIGSLNKAFYDYWKTSITLTASNGNSIAVGQYNKPSTYDYNDFTIIDGRWGKTSIGASTTYPDITEMVVEGGVVSEIRHAQPAARIPQNGYVVVTRQAGSQLLNENFKVGDTVGMDISTDPDWKKIKMAATGSSILMRDGEIPEKFSVDTVNNRPNPRTAIGSSKSGRQLILVTVDGRQDSSMGMTLNEMARLMLELGAYNALNLDGGGSTTMVGRIPGTKDLQVVNKPSDGMSRGLSTAIGIFSTAPQSPLSRLKIDTIDRNVFVDTTRDFSVRGHDRHFNPAEVEPGQVKWSVSGVEGSFKGSAFFPKSTGKGIITAAVGDISTAFNITVLDSPVQLQLSEKSLNLPLNRSKTFTVTGKNAEGYSAYINPKDAVWSVKGDIGSFNENTFTASGQGTGYISVSIGRTHAYCAVSVASEGSSIKDSFETNNGTFLSYPAGIMGNYEISAEQKHSGKSSGKLSYDFPASEDSRAAYMVFSNGGIPLESNTTKIGLWVYNDHITSNWLSAEILDSDNKKNRVYFAKNPDWTGWKYVELSLQGIDTPSRLTRIYLVQVNPVSDSGSIFIDDLSLMSSGYPSIDLSQIPQDTVPVDKADKKVTYVKNNESFRFSVFGQSREPVNPLEKLLSEKLSEKINRYIDAAAFVGNSAHEISGLVKKPCISTNTGYNSFDIKNSRFIQLDMSIQGLRASDPGQWTWFLQQLYTAKGNNIFIFMAGPPEEFNDNLEAALFQKILAKYRQDTGKTIWVFHNADKNSSCMKEGIKYITAAGYNVEGLAPEDTGLVKYILVTVKGDSVTFEFKPIVHKGESK